MSDWDAVEQIWNTTFRDMLRVNPTEHPLLCTEPAWNTVENREKMMELAFEKFEFPAFYLAKDAVMTAYVYNERKRERDTQRPGYECL